MNRLDTFPDLNARIPQDLIVFDGHCVFCSSFFRFMLRHDNAHFAYATAQSPLGQDLYRALGLPTDDFATNLVIAQGVIHQRLDAFTAAMAQLPAPYTLLAVLRYLPSVIKDPTYHLIARNRYKIWGRTEACLMPTPDLRSRFLPGGL